MDSICNRGGAWGINESRREFSDARKQVFVIADSRTLLVRLSDVPHDQPAKRNERASRY